jgi:hypothetical protein
VADDTVDRVRALDHDGKIEIVFEDFVKTDDPMKNETYQRQFSADLLAKQGTWQWIFQIDADEIFLDFPGVLKQVRSLKVAQFAYWRWISAFNILDDGRLLIIVDEDGNPNLERFPLAHRPGAVLKKAREIERPDGLLYKIFKWRYEGGKNAHDAVLHLSYAKSEKRIKEKLATFSHSKDFDGEKFYEMWLASKADWASMHNFHPMAPANWPRLRAFTLEELKNVACGRK